MRAGKSQNRTPLPEHKKIVRVRKTFFPSAMFRLVLTLALALVLAGCGNQTATLPDADKKSVAELMDLAKASTSADELRFFAAHANAGVRSDAAKNAALPPDLQPGLAKDSDWLVRSFLGANPTLNPDIAKELSSDEDPRVRWVVAKNPVTPKEVLQTLAGDSHPEVQKKLAANSALDEELMLTLAESGQEAAVLELLKRKDLPETVQEKIKARPEAAIQKAVNSL